MKLTYLLAIFAVVLAGCSSDPSVVDCTLDPEQCNPEDGGVPDGGTEIS